MKASSKFVWLSALAFGIAASGIVTPVARAQDLKAELDALDDLPEDDLSAGTTAPSTPSASSSSVPDAGSFDAAKTSTPSSSAPSSSPAKELGVGDLDLQGLEQELNFDSFKDGGKVGLDQLQNAPKGNLGDETRGRVTSIDFKQLQDRVRLVVSADRPIDWTRELRSKRRQVIVELRNMEIAREILKRALDTGEFEGPVALVQAFPAKVGGRDSVKILFQLRSFVDPTVLRTGNDLVIDFPIAGGDTLFRSRAAGRVIVPKTYLSANDTKEFKGTPITINVKSAELGDFLNLISRSAGKNFVLSGSVGTDKKITMNLTNVPWDQALSIALFNSGLGYQELDSVIRIATVEELGKELDIAREAANKSRDLIPVETRLIPINYADVATLQTNLAPFLTKDRGNVTVEKRTNTLVITDIPEVLEKVSRYVTAVDKQTPQVLIEARIVEANQGFNKSKNFAWTVGSNIVDGQTKHAQFNVGGAYPSSTAPGIGANQGLRLRFGNLGGIDLVDTLLNFNETQNNSRTISSPRVTVLANETATISQGRKTSVTRVDVSGNTVSQEINVPTNLTVTPQVSADGFVFMDVTITRDILVDPGSNIAPPIIDTRYAKTKMVVENGKTAVIGGIYQDDISESESGIPFLRKIPIFGSLFTNVKKSVKQANELLIFLAPRVINQDVSRIQGTASLGGGPSATSAEMR
ncbi:MAG: secretin N-terminal domain-containing protein [Bdellovibrionota bacterium]